MPVSQSLSSPCPICYSPLETLCISFSEQLLSCPSSSCIYPFNQSSISQFILQAPLSERLKSSLPLDIVSPASVPKKCIHSNKVLKVNNPLRSVDASVKGKIVKVCNLNFQF
ncbi:hypothetical protein BKA69DRAFT_1076127 [Paraphysoderma sedebokerense]|nr:hypothetical protein BKA69DRAFT_1076127 [Paraphysoderma sedebokerense]